MTDWVIISNFCVNVSTCGDKNYIFVLVIVIGLLFCKICPYNGNTCDKKKKKKVIYLISCKMESNFDGYNDSSDCQ
jgi:hypothetical protein